LESASGPSRYDRSWPRPSTGGFLTYGYLGDADHRFEAAKQALPGKLARSPADMNGRIALRALVFDSLEEQIAVIDQAGNIVEVNSAWTSFGIENGLAADFDCVGRNYLDVVHRSFSAGDERAREAAQGIAQGPAVAAGQ
jgi:hypothetical protein